MKAGDWHELARAKSPDLPPVHSVRELRAMPARALERYTAERNVWLQHVQFPWPAGALAQRRLSELVTNNALRPPGSKNVIAVTAKHTAGKSTLVGHWARGYYEQILGDAINDPMPPTWQPRPGIAAQDVPVCWIDLGSGKTRLFTMQILKYFGYPTTGLIPDLIARFADVVENHRLKLLVVDDINLLQLGNKDARQVLDHLKHVNTVLGQHGGSLVLVGRRESNSLVYTDPQLAGRLQVIALNTFGTETAEQRAEWQTFLHGAEKLLLPYLPAAEPRLLAEMHAPYIWRRTQGFISDTAELLKEATHLAALDGSWTIRETHIEKAHLSARATQEELALPAATKARRATAVVRASA